MENFLGDFYLWTRALHIISVIFWVAGMLMLPRYFAYHAECPVGGDEDLRWRQREARLLRIIVNPAMIAAWLFGLALAVNLGWHGGWLHVKLLIVFGFSGFHGVMGRWRRNFALGRNHHGSRFYRMMNEIPSLVVIIVVILAVVKPF